MLSNLAWIMAATVIPPHLMLLAASGTVEEPLSSGFGPENVTQHSGYISVNEAHGNDGHLFFWMFEARKDPKTAPLVLWLTGGPGCSSELAVFYEQGPYRLGKDGTISNNPHAWNSIANVLFVDQPVGTGFSYADDSAAYVKNEEQVAEDMWEFMQAFLKRFPEYAGLDFYVTGESYAGHYVPAISSHIAKGNKALSVGEVKVHLIGFAIGNGLVDPQNQYSQYVPFAQSKSLIGSKTAMALNATTHACVASIEAGNSGMGTMGMCNSIVEGIQLAGGYFNVYDVREKCTHPPLCYDFDALGALLLKPETQAALGVSPKAPKWQSCNMKVHLQMMGDWFADLEEVIPAMLADGVRMLVYSGQEDFICNWFGGRDWVSKMVWPGQSAYNKQTWGSWTVDGALGGVYKEQANVQFLGIANAGHMVPMDQPSNALAMLHIFLTGRSLGCPTTVDAAGVHNGQDFVGCGNHTASPPNSL